MRLTLAIFRKDTRRLWREIAVSVGLLAALAQMDVNRVDSLPGAPEGWLNLLVPAAWAWLIALLIHQEALVGDRQFWITRPYPRAALVTAKALFALAFIHGPLLLADTVILAAHGFNPLAYAPQLAWKQLALAGAVTLPAAALGAVTRNLPQFALAAAVLGGAGLVLAGGIEGFSSPWQPADSARQGIVVVVLSLAGIAMVALQYARRRTALSRTLGIGAVLVAALLFALLPRAYTAAVRCALSPADGAFSIGLAPRSEQHPAVSYRGNVEFLAIPISVSGIPDGAAVWFEQLAFELTGPSGERWQYVAPPGRPWPRLEPVLGGISVRERNQGWHSVVLERSVYGKIADQKVNISGQAVATLSKPQEPVRMPVGAAPRAVPGLGQCSSVLIDDPTPFGREPMLKVVCESPSEIPRPVRVKLTEAGTSHEWIHGLGDSGRYVTYPVQTWLSPLNRRQTFFHIVEERRTEPGTSWLVPREALSHAEITIVPEQPWAALSFLTRSPMCGLAIGA